MSKSKSKPRPRRTPAAQPTHLCEAAVVEGLEVIAADELQRELGDRLTLLKPPQDSSIDGVIRFTCQGSLHALKRLKTVTAVFLVHYANVPRPRALLGDAHLRDLLAQIALVRAIKPVARFETLYLAAAGSDSRDMTRLKHELAEHLGLVPAEDEGDLLLRLRRPADGRDGWEVLIRLSPRPLATRDWRVCNLEGALNATVAQAMARLTNPHPGDVVLNLACGSGTLLIERAGLAPARRILGCDTDEAALACARQNVAASGFESQIELHPWDATKLPLEGGSVDVLLADLPFGHLVGSHEANLTLYPALLAEAARVAAPSAACVIISHEVRLMESLLEASSDWQLRHTVRINLGGLHPRIFVLQRQGGQRRGGG